MLQNSPHINFKLKKKEETHKSKHTFRLYIASAPK